MRAANTPFNTSTELANPSSTTTSLHYRPRRISGAATLLPFGQATGGALCRAEHRDRHEQFPGTTPEVVSYPAIGVLSGSLGAVDANQSIAIRSDICWQILAAGLRSAGDGGRTVGGRQGASTAGTIMSTPSAPPSSALTFVSSPARNAVPEPTCPLAPPFNFVGNAPKPVQHQRGL